MCGQPFWARSYCVHPLTWRVESRGPVGFSGVPPPHPQACLTSFPSGLSVGGSDWAKGVRRWVRSWLQEIFHSVPASLESPLASFKMSVLATPNFLLTFYFILESSRLTMLCQFQGHSKGTPPYYTRTHSPPGSPPIQAATQH